MKRLFAVLAAITVAGGVFGCSGSKTNDSAGNGSTPAATTQSSDATAASGSAKACDILTNDDAKKVLGDGAKAGKSNNDSPTESEHMTVTTCTYDNGDDTKTATVLVRAAKSDKGVQANQSAFGSDKPTDAQDVTGYGDKAFWSPQFAQLNVLKNNNWYIISNGPLSPANNTLEEAKRLADLIITRL